MGGIMNSAMLQGLVIGTQLFRNISMIWMAVLSLTFIVLYCIVTFLSLQLAEFENTRGFQCDLNKMGEQGNAWQMQIVNKYEIVHFDSKDIEDIN